MILIFLTHPNGDVLEVSARITDLGKLHDEFESGELTELVHSDIDFALDNQDDALTAFFAGATATGDKYAVEVWRDTGGRRPKMRLEFAGVLDLPWSIEYDDAGKSITIQAFGNSKLLENATAENIKRVLTGRTASVTAASDTVTPTSVTDLNVGDEVTLTDGANDETQVIASIAVSTFATVANWAHTFTAAAMTVETPYYRDQSVRFLVGRLFDEAGITDREIVTSALSTAIPFGGQVSAVGVTGAAVSVVQANGLIQITTDDGRFGATDIDESYVSTGAGTAEQGDWYPYLDAQPAAILEGAQVGLDHTNGHKYTMDVRARPGLNWELWILKNGADFSMVDSFTDPTDQGYSAAYCEWDALNALVWWSYERIDTTAEKLGYTTQTPTNTTFSTTAELAYAKLRLVNAPTPLLALQPVTIPGTTAIRFIELVGKTLIKPAADLPVGAALNGYDHNTLKAFDSKQRIAAAYILGGFTHVRVWTIAGMETANDFRIAPGTAGAMRMSPFDRGGEVALVGYTGFTYFAVSRLFVGFVSYADFSGMSVGAALAELAVITGSFVSVSNHVTGLFAPRDTVMRDRSYEIAEAAIDQSRQHITDSYRDSVELTGTTDAGEDFAVVRGLIADESRRLSLSSTFVTSVVSAAAVCDLYLGLLSTPRGEIEGTFHEPAEPYLPLDRIILQDGKTYDVLSVISALDAEEQELRLLEVV